MVLDMANSSIWTHPFEHCLKLPPLWILDVCSPRGGGYRVSGLGCFYHFDCSLRGYEI